MEQKTDNDEFPLNPEIDADGLFIDMTRPATSLTESTPVESTQPQDIQGKSTTNDRRGPRMGRRASDGNDTHPRMGRRASDALADQRFRDVWATLRAVDCSNLATNKQGGARWYDILDLLMTHFPDTTWETLPDVHHAENSMEVGCKVTIAGVSRSTNLQVESASGRLLIKPNAQQVSEARMRCWMRCVSLFGLGLDLQTGDASQQSSSELESGF